jgi:hypothetical protein
VYSRTGELLSIAESGSGITLKIDPALDTQPYRLRGDGQTLTITGGSDVAVLYGVYHFAEEPGVRIYLHGDVIPDDRSPLNMKALRHSPCPPQLRVSMIPNRSESGG